MQHVAINPKHQRALDRLYKADRRYCEQVDRYAAYLDSLDPNSGKFYAAEERIVQKGADLFDDLVDRFIDEPELPKRELEAFAKSYEAFHGYTPYLV